MEKALIRTKKLILHIGSWKTGTTSIQSYLSGKYQQLKADKVLYPMTSRRRADGGVDTAHHRLRMLLDGADGAMTLQVAGVLDRMAVELKQAQCETLLLSSETFMDFRRPETLRRYIEADEVQIVAVFRNQAEFISSMYYTEVCHRKVIDLPMDYLDGFNGNLLDYASCLVPWRRAWPEAQFSVSLFERGTPARDFPAAHMMAQIGLNWPVVAEDNHVEHKSLPAQATLFLRQLAASGWDDMSFFDVFKMCHRNADWFAPVKEHYSPDVLQQIFADYAPQNKALAEEFVSNGPREFAPLVLTERDTWERAMGDTSAVFPTILKRISRSAANACT